MKDATRGPVFACLYPGLCEIARGHGYALAIHGSLVGDMDLVAIPWIEGAVDAVTLKDALMHHIGACGYDALLERDSPWLTEDQRRQVCEQQGIGLEGEHAEKPHGRIAWNLYLWAGTKVDLSILPRLAGSSPVPCSGEAVAERLRDWAAEIQYGLSALRKLADPKFNLCDSDAWNLVLRADEDRLRTLLDAIAVIHSQNASLSHGDESAR